MAIPSRQIGWSTQSNLLWQISKQLERLTCVTAGGCGTTTTTTTAPLSLKLTFDDIANANTLVGDASSVTDWNTFFDLPAYGNAFTSVSIVGNNVNLIGGSNITIKQNLFYDFTNNIGCPYIISIEDEGAVVTIGGDAFVACYLLTSVSFLECTTIVGYGDTLYYGSFGECFNLVTINFPKLIYAGDGSFYNTSLINVNLPLLEVTEYGVFQNCTSLISIDLPSLTTLGGQSFLQCAELVSVNIPLITTINGYAFQYCGKLTTVNAPIVTIIHDGGFSDCESLVSVNFPLLVSIDYYTFRGCFLLNSIYFPLLTYIAYNSFINCYSLTEVNLPLVTNVEMSAFYSCNLLNIIYIPSCTTLGNTVLNNDVFYRNTTGQTITLTVPAALMTCNSGNPDGDIQYLQANNTVTIITV